MKTFKIDMTPDSHLIESVINTSITAPEAISELVDNSFDAGASSVVVKTTGGSITVSDDGGGCSDLQSMLAFGKHRKQAGTKLGRYGVGLKNATCGMGEILAIETTKMGVTRSAEISWSDIGLSGWDSPHGSESDQSERKSGTEIVISKLRRKVIHEHTKKALSFSFAPAIWSGRCLSLNGGKIEPWKLPALTDRIYETETHDSLQISFEVTAGITERNDRDPFILSYEHRIIGGTTMPCKEYNTSSKFIALVKLTGDWALLKHKDGLRDGVEAEWLWDRLNSICGPLLQKVHKLGESEELGEMSSDITEAFEIAKGKQKRPGINGEEVDSRPTGKQRKVHTAAVVAGDGDVSERDAIKQRQKKISVLYGEYDPDQLGKVDVNQKRANVILNVKHPHVAECRRDKNKDALMSHAVYLLSRHQSMSPPKDQTLFKFEQETESGRFLELASKIFTSLKGMKRA